MIENDRDLEVFFQDLFFSYFFISELISPYFIFLKFFDIIISSKKERNKNHGMESSPLLSDLDDCNH